MSKKTDFTRNEIKAMIKFTRGIVPLDDMIQMRNLRPSTVKAIAHQMMQSGEIEPLGRGFRGHSTKRTAKSVGVTFRSIRNA